MHGAEVLEAHSAGSQPSGVVNDRAVSSMREVGYDLSAHKSKSLDDVPGDEYDYVVTMGCGDECPIIPARRRDDWDIPDPKEMPVDEFRKVREEIERRVRKLITEVTLRP